MARFQYDNLTSDQLRIGIALLNQESAVVEALEAAVEKAVGEAVSPFGITAGDITAHGNSGGAAGGARTKATKRAALRQLHAAADQVHTDLDKVPLTGGQVRKRGSKRKVSPRQLASRELQGSYISAIRSVPESRRSKYKAIVKKHGRQAAIDAIYGDYPHNRG